MSKKTGSESGFTMLLFAVMFCIFVIVVGIEVKAIRSECDATRKEIKAFKEFVINPNGHSHELAEWNKAIWNISPEM